MKKPTRSHSSARRVCADKKLQAKVLLRPRAKSIIATPTVAALAPADGGIHTDDDVKRAIAALRRKCAYMRAAHDAAGHPPLRRRAGGFDGLVRIINGQQLSVASAAAIHARVEAMLKPLTAVAVQAATDAALRDCGLSRPKIKTLRALSSAVVGGLCLDALADVPAAEATAQLTAVSGIGPWTADIYLMFCVGHADVFAAGDLALQIAAQKVIGLETRPTSRQMAEIAERWRPHRAVAARLLWAYYAVAKKQGISVPV